MRFVFVNLDTIDCMTIDIETLPSKISVIFDKTGTLTKGKPAITDFRIFVEDDDLVLLIIIPTPIILKPKLCCSLSSKSGRTKILWGSRMKNLTPRREEEVVMTLKDLHS